MGEDLGDDADGNLLRCLRPDVQADGTEEAAKFFCAEGEGGVEALCLVARSEDSEVGYLAREQHLRRFLVEGMACDDGVGEGVGVHLRERLGEGGSDHEALGMGKEGGGGEFAARLDHLDGEAHGVGEGGDGLVDVPAADKQQGVGLDGEGVVAAEVVGGHEGGKL